MVGIIFLGELEVCPYLKKYTDVLDRLGIAYEIISWNRGGRLDAPAANELVFQRPSKKMVHPIRKLLDFWLFGRFAARAVRSRGYEKLVVLTTLTGMLLYRLLTRQYRGSYIFDYRDASYEYLPFFRHFLKQLVAKSNFTCISSRGFLDILPAGYDYTIAHNFRYCDLSARKQKMQKKQQDPIIVSYIGVLREADYLKQLIDLFGDDLRFWFYIHGGGENEQQLQEHAARYQNVFVSGTYAPNQKQGLVEAADILCYNYPASFINNPALANKYYDGLIYKKPFFANGETYSGQLIQSQGLGFCVKGYGDSAVCDALYQYYRALDPATFTARAEACLEEVLAEDRQYIDRIEQFFRL